MKKLIESKIAVLVLAIAGLIALVLLSVALRDISFRPPEPFSFNLGGFSTVVSSGPGMQIPIWKYFLFGGLLLLILTVIMFFLDPELRKRILLRLLRFGLAMAFFWLIITYAFDNGVFRDLLRLPVSAGGGAPSASSPAASPVYAPPQISPWLVFAVSFVIGLALVLLGWFIYVRRLKPRASQARDELAGIAADALNELRAGPDWDDAIVRAYIRMHEVVVAERGLLRQPGNTPSEFSRRMERIGLPVDAVRTLTRLFEAVRYGGKTSSPAERDLAAAALSAILHYCGRNS